MKRVLIVDDDPDIRKYCQTKLAALGHLVIAVGSADEALCEVSTTDFDLLVIDINMPEKDGFDLLRALKGIPSKTFHVLMLTGRRTPQDVRAALELGAVDYICKPIRKETFISKIESFLGVRTPPHELYFSPTSADSEVWVANRAGISSLSETGLVMNANFLVKVNISMKIAASLFDQIGIPSPQIRVTQCVLAEKNLTFEFQISGSFIGMDEESLEKIRNWLINQTIALRKVG